MNMDIDLFERILITINLIVKVCRCMYMVMDRPELYLAYLSDNVHPTRVIFVSLLWCVFNILDIG